MNDRPIEGSVVKLITIRLPPELKDAVHAAAHDNHMSLNTYCIRALSKSLPKGTIAKEPQDGPADRF